MEKECWIGRSLASIKCYLRDVDRHAKKHFVTSCREKDMSMDSNHHIYTIAVWQGVGRRIDLIFDYLEKY